MPSVEPISVGHRDLTPQRNVARDAASQPRFYPRALNRQVHGLRGLAALLVFLFHVYGIGTLWRFWPADYVAAFDWLRFGRHAVELFFIISGYLIAASVRRHADAGRFLLDRCIRIYPVFLTIHLLVFGLGPVIGYKWMSGISLGAWLENFASNALFLPGLLDLPIAQFNAWSLSYEAAFYLLAAATYVLARRFGRVGGWVVFAAAMPLLYLYAKASFFLVGVAVHFLKPRVGIGSPAWLRAASPILLAATFFLLTYDEAAALPIYLACVSGFLFFWCIVDGGCVVSTVLRSPALQYFGTISYSFYLWGALVTYAVRLAILRWLPDPAGSNLSILVFFICGFALSVGVSHLSFLVLEERAGQLLRRATAGWLGRVDTNPAPIEGRPA